MVSFDLNMRIIAIWRIFRGRNPHGIGYNLCLGFGWGCCIPNLGSTMLPNASHGMTKMAGINARPTRYSVARIDNLHDSPA